jgi:glycosyltransferase involved in cell wall biosynthesis
VRVGISLLTLAPSDLGGSETYARQLTRALSSVGTHEYTAFVPARAKDAAGGLSAVEVRESVATRGPSRIPAMAVSALRSREVRSELEHLDVLHYALTVPLPRTDLPTVVTLHDVQHRDLPDFFGLGRRSFRRVAYDRASRTASAVVVTSEFVRGRAVELLGLDPTRVHVVPHGVDHSLFHPSDEEEREPFILYPARPWPHKNHARLLEAFVSLRDTRPRLRLVLTGGGLERLDPLPEGVTRLGSVSAERVASLYRRAACLVFPSLYEGFGLPPLEAMACGCPVAAADAGAIPEVCGDAAVLFDPTDVESIAAGILEADERSQELREKGLARAAAYTWEETARLHEAAYEVAASEAPVGMPMLP